MIVCCETIQEELELKIRDIPEDIIIDEDIRQRCLARHITTPNGIILCNHKHEPIHTSHGTIYYQCRDMTFHIYKKPEEEE